MLLGGFMATGIYKAYKKDNSPYYRVSITYKSKHISLGSSDNYETANAIYKEAKRILKYPNKYFVNPDKKSSGFNSMHISLAKYISLVNFRDNGIYIKTPIYLSKNSFIYFLSENVILTFSIDDLFYYSNHTIQARGGYYFVADYGMQTSILSRYGIKAHAIKGKDYIFKNGDDHDFRYENVQVINKYNGVSQFEKNGRIFYRTKIHINGDFLVGIYNSETEAALAYNKAISLLENKTDINYSKNYVDGLTNVEYAAIYNSIRLKKNFRDYVDKL